jgi:hypothetical protein
MIIKNSLIIAFIAAFLLFLNVDSHGKENFTASILKARQETINKLIASFNQSNDIEYKRSVLYTLGMMRATEAVPFLIKNIDYGIYNVIMKLPKYDPEPASYALSKIGLPSITPILNHIKKSTENKNVGLFCNTLVNIGGHDLAIFYLQKEIKKTKDANELARLKNALKIVFSYTPNDSKLELTNK